MSAHPGRRRFDSPQRRLMLVLGLLLIAAGVWFVHAQSVSLHHLSHRLTAEQKQLGRLSDRIAIEQKLLGTQHTSLVEACNRLQIQRIETNRSNLADFDVFTVVDSETRLSPIPPGQTPLQRTFRARFLRKLHRAILLKAWTPRTSCKRAVALRGVHYRAPAPVQFSERQPPPDALRLNPADLRP